MEDSKRHLLQSATSTPAEGALTLYFERFVALLLSDPSHKTDSFAHACEGPSSTFLSAQRCWTSWECRGWQLLERQRPCVPSWTRREWWMAASPMMEMPFYMGPAPFTETSTWIVKYVSWWSAHLQRIIQRDHVLHFRWWMITYVCLWCLWNKHVWLYLEHQSEYYYYSYYCCQIYVLTSF